LVFPDPALNASSVVAESEIRILMSQAAKSGQALSSFPSYTGLHQRVKTLPAQHQQAMLDRLLDRIPSLVDRQDVRRFFGRTATQDRWSVR